MYRRINVTRNAGAGKSTVATQLGDLLNLPVFSLDRIVWRPGWRETPPDERRQLEKELTSKGAWIIDGVSRTVREAADLVIFLDVPRVTCLCRCARRNWRYVFRSRPGLPENCPEILIVPRLVRIIWKFPRTVRSSILKETRTLTRAEYRSVSSRKDLRRLYSELSAN